VTQSFDVIINGGGMAGASLAWGLNHILGKEHALNIAIIEASLDDHNHAGFDARVIALSYGSRQILEQLGLWPHYQSLVTPINKISVTDRHHFGHTHILPNDHQVPHLGYVVELADSGRLLMNQLSTAQSSKHITWFKPNSIDALTQHQNSVEVLLSGGQQLSAKLIVAADGAFSKIRTLLNIDKTVTEFNQSAIIANVSTNKSHDGEAFERFTKNGPLAFLPMSQGRSSVVWSMASEQVDDVMGLTDDQFLARLQQAFGFRLGTLTKTGKRVSYPLIQNVANCHIHHRTALVGNAAQALHPIAGQGFNLGLRDVAALIDKISKAVIEKQDIGSYQVLNSYQKSRSSDQLQTIGATSSLVSLFSNDHWPLVMGRNVALQLSDCFDFLKKPVAQQMLGWRHNLTTLEPISTHVSNKASLNI
jgi:2-octaprenyl-6-methoxyphenol hydroxylase